MKRFVPAFGVPLILAVGLVQGDTRIPALPLAALSNGSPYSLAPLTRTQAQFSAPYAPVPDPRITVSPHPVSPYVQSSRAPGDIIPHTYMVYGLRTGPGGMAFTDRNGAAIPVPSNPQIILKPFNGLPAGPPQVLPPTYTIPRSDTFPRTIPIPAPRK